MSTPPAKRFKASPQRTVLLVRHGEGQHQLKKAAAKAVQIDAKLGPALTPLGVQQAQKAAQLLSDVLQRISEETGDASPPLVVSSNLVRAVHTAMLVAPMGAEVVVQPLLRERISFSCDEPSELEALRSWIEAQQNLAEVQLHLYEEALLEFVAGASPSETAHAAYIRDCYAWDLIGEKQNKAKLKERAEAMTAWVESQDAQVIVLVGHACFLNMITGDKDWLDNAEVRCYAVSDGSWSRSGRFVMPKAQLPAVRPPAAWAPGVQVPAVRPFAAWAPGAQVPAVRPLAAWAPGCLGPVAKAATPRPRGSLAMVFGARPPG
eukprot:TRINITY_DN28556_c0_g1_i1.p1 TRINITY_DN28556_c0_g1~~TRINITY_DN28556_c0_g1_i1.p1  ORF type:complete len:327 (-),score=55.59 TRINITY_DN28556_c0_g1_i1:96-1055(-)